MRGMDEEMVAVDNIVRPAKMAVVSITSTLAVRDSMSIIVVTLDEGTSRGETISIGTTMTQLITREYLHNGATHKNPLTQTIALTMTKATLNTQAQTIQDGIEGMAVAAKKIVTTNHLGVTTKEEEAGKR